MPQKKLARLRNGELGITKCKRNRKNGKSHLAPRAITFFYPWDGLDGSAPHWTLGNASVNVGTLSVPAGKGLVQSLCRLFRTLADKGTGQDGLVKVSVPHFPGREKEGKTCITISDSTLAKTITLSN